MSVRGQISVAVLVLSLGGLVALLLVPVSTGVWTCGVVGFFVFGAAALSQIHAELRPESTPWTEARSEVDR